jgi:2-polyprenyl-6-methoxyphenol hydroxylase-like FAD-dependent oxidoreductase
MVGSDRHDVIISGAGPVGLFLASELALAGCSVVILEQAETLYSALKQMPFGIRGLSTPSIEALDRRGLLDDLDVHKHLKNPHITSTPTQGLGRQGGHFAGIPFIDGNIDTSQWQFRLASSTPTSLITDMEEIEAVLTRRAVSSGVQIKCGFGVTGFRQSKDEVAVQSGEEFFRGGWLVGCDGSRSAVRKAGGFEFAGTDPEFTGYSAKVDIADPQKLKPGRNLTAKGMYFQSRPGYLVMVEFDRGASHRSAPISLEQVQETLRRVSETDVTIAALHAATTWTDRARQATTYRNGRVLLAGDAAHIHSPLGGQGLNLGLGDAMNLGWKLAATIRGKAPPALLDSFQTERHPLGEQVLDWSRAQVAIMKPDRASRALNAVIRDLIGTRDGATYVAGRVWGVATGYHLGAGHPLVGCSVPNFMLDDGVTINARMRDGRGVLLDFDRSPLLEALVRRCGGTVNYLSGRSQERFGLSALLIRPDGIIAWASKHAADPSELQQAAARWFAVEWP